MSSDINKPFEVVVCEKFGKLMPGRSAWCPLCGDGGPQVVNQELRQGAYPVSLIWIFTALVLVPLAACGSCAVVGFTQQNIRPTDDIFPTATANIALAVEVLSVIVGIILLTYNFIKGRQ